MERLTALKSLHEKILNDKFAERVTQEEILALAEFEDKLESGKLIELPCIVNTLNPKFKVIVFRGKDGELYKSRQFETIEAEARLKELQSK